MPWRKRNRFQQEKPGGRQLRAVCKTEQRKVSVQQTSAETLAAAGARGSGGFHRSGVTEIMSQVEKVTLQWGPRGAVAQATNWLLSRAMVWNPELQGWWTWRSQGWEGSKEKPGQYIPERGASWGWHCQAPQVTWQHHSSWWWASSGTPESSHQGNEMFCFPPPFQPCVIQLIWHEA